MPHWKALPDELDPQVRELAGRLRALVDHSGMSVATVADRTGYGKSSWERYLNGRLLPPEGAVAALAQVTRADTGRLAAQWELAEQAWNRVAAQRDGGSEAARPPGERPGRGGLVPPPQQSAKSSVLGPVWSFPLSARRAGAAAQAGNSRQALRPARPPAGPGPAGPPGPPAPSGGRRSRMPLLLAALVGALLIVAAAVLLLGPEEKDEAAQEIKTPLSPAASKKPELPKGAKCTGADCTGEDPEAMGCGGKYTETVADATVGGALVEVRYSKVCGAAWARITEAAPGDEVRVTAGKRTETGTAGENNETYTSMVAASSPERVTACVRTKARWDRGCARPR